MAFCRWSLRACRPLPTRCPAIPTTLGEHVVRRRLELGLRLKAVAEQIGVSPQSLSAWEHGQAKPMLRQYPAIFDFLGYCPVSPRPLSLGQRLWRWRRAHGLSRTKVASLLRVDTTTLWKLERDRTTEPVMRVRQKVLGLMAGAGGTGK